MDLYRVVELAALSKLTNVRHTWWFELERYDACVRTSSLERNSCLRFPSRWTGRWPTGLLEMKEDLEHFDAHPLLS